MLGVLVDTIFMGLNNNGTKSNFTDAQLGAMSVHMAMPEITAQAFTSAISVLWETCTGLILP